MSQIISPTPIGYGAIDLSWIVGRAITDVSFVEPTLWRFFFDKSEHIGVECMWRIIRGERIVRTSEDHGQQFGLPAPVHSAQEATALLSQATIVVAKVREATADILIEFSGGLRLEIISDSSGYESWQLYAPAGVCFVAQGGGQICTWTRNA